MPTENQFAQPGGRIVFGLPPEPEVDTEDPSDHPVQFKPLDFNTEANDDEKDAVSISPGGVSPTSSKGRKDGGSTGAVESKDLASSITALPLVPLPRPTPQGASRSRTCPKDHPEEDYETVKIKLAANSVPSKREVRDYILENQRPPI